MLKKSIVSIFTISTVCASTQILAADAMGDSKFYGVISVGRAQLDANPIAVDRYDLNNGFTASQTNTDTRATGGKIQLGYGLGKTFSLEGGYTFLGKTHFTSSTNAGVIGGDKDASLVNLDVVAKYPVTDNFSVLGRFGGYFWQTRSAMPNTSQGTTTVNDYGSNFKIGAGMQYDFTPRFGVRGEFERYNGIGNDSTSGDSKVNQLTVGAVLKF